MKEQEKLFSLEDILKLLNVNRFKHYEAEDVLHAMTRELMNTYGFTVEELKSVYEKFGHRLPPCIEKK